VRARPVETTGSVGHALSLDRRFPTGSPGEEASSREHTCGATAPDTGAPTGGVTLSHLQQRCDERPFGVVVGLRVEVTAPWETAAGRGRDAASEGGDEPVADERSDERATVSVGGAAGGRPDGSGASPDRDPDVDTDAGPDVETPRIVVLVRADCRTCDRMEGVVREIGARVGEEHVVVDVDAADTDPEWRAEYGDRIPVTLVDGVEIGSWRIEPDDLVRALTGGDVQ
jgi:Glutaredoxin-like domain (DUF836)